jgi:magnesium-transporting ATPase (P-type)
VGIWKEGLAHGWLDGSTIYIAVVLIVSVTAGNNWVKQKQFLKLMALSQDLYVTVTRGGKKNQLSVYSLLVGDII